MITAKDLGRALEELGFQKGKVGTGPEAADGYLWRADRVLVAVTRKTIESFFAPPEGHRSGAPWPVFIHIELRFLHAADTFRRHGVPTSHKTFEQYLTCLTRMGVFPQPMGNLYEFVEPEQLDLAMRVNMQAMTADLTADIFEERLAPILEALRHAEIYMVFGAMLDSLRDELEKKTRVVT